MRDTAVHSLLRRGQLALACLFVACGASVADEPSVVVHPGDPSPAPVLPPTRSTQPSPVDLPVELDSMVLESRHAPRRTIRAGSTAQLHSALKLAQGGDEIVLTAGTTYRGHFEIPKTRGSGWLVIRSSATALPPIGQRIRPSDAPVLAVFQGVRGAEPVIRLAAGAARVRLAGLEIRPAVDAREAYSLLELGSPLLTDSASIPRSIVVERSWIHGSSRLPLQRCVSLQSGATAIIDSWIDDCHAKGYDSQAIAGWNGAGPYLIQNNLLAGAGENVMFGGADPARQRALPSDIVIRGNHFYKPAEWMGKWTVKNLLELKVGIRVLIENNVLENNWADAQSGAAVLLRSVNQDGGAPWAETRDVTMRYNVIRNSANGLNAVGVGTAHPAVAMRRVYIAHNSWERIGYGDYPGGVLWQIAGIHDLTFEHNTGFGRTHGVQFLCGDLLNLKVIDNVIGLSAEGNGFDFTIGSAEGAGFGTAAVRAHAINWKIEGNRMTKGASAFPPGNRYGSSPAALGVRDFPTVLALQDGTTSPVGVDYAELRTRTAGVTVKP
jgi:hypothetical protein